MNKAKNVLFEIKELDLQIKKRIMKVYKENSISITPAQSKLLFYLKNNKDNNVTQKDLEKITFLSKSTLSESINNMVNDGLIIKISNEKDNRIKYISLTNKAYELLGDIEDEFSKIENSIINNVSDNDLNKFFEVISIFKSNLN